MSEAADALSTALHRHETIASFENHGYTYAWVKKDPETIYRYLLVERKPEHVYWKLRSMGVDWAVWQRMQELGAGAVDIVYQDGHGKTVFRATLATWRMHGVVIMEHAGFKTQMQLPIERMDVAERSCNCL